MTKEELQEFKEIVAQAFDKLGQIGGIKISAAYYTNNEWGHKVHHVSQNFINYVIHEEEEKGLRGSPYPLKKFCEKVLNDDVNKDGVLNWTCPYKLCLTLRDSI
jgi:hypothetical protein